MQAMGFLILKERFEIFYDLLQFANNLIAWNSLWMTASILHFSEVAACNSAPGAFPGDL